MGRFNTAEAGTPQRFLLKNLCGVPISAVQISAMPPSAGSAPRVSDDFDLRRLAWPRFESRLRELHPYDVPEIVALRPEQVAGSYARWVGECVA